MTTSIRAFEGVMEMMSELFFASLEPGNNYTTEPIILNTALYYALGYAAGPYVNVSQNKRTKKQLPGYVEDTSTIAQSLYVSVADPIGIIKFTSELTNARSDDYIQYNKQEKQINSPTGKYGVRKQILPGAIFRFFVLSFDGTEPDMPPYIRVGKKRAKAVISWKELSVREKSGEFALNHTVLIDDLKEMPIRDIRFKRMQPFDVIQHGGFSGRYLAIGEREETIFPADIRFLQRLRG